MIKENITSWQCLQCVHWRFFIRTRTDSRCCICFLLIIIRLVSGPDVKQNITQSANTTKLGFTSHSTHNRSFPWRVFPDNQLHRYWQPELSNKNKTCIANSEYLTETKKVTQCKCGLVAVRTWPGNKVDPLLLAQSLHRAYILTLHRLSLLQKTKEKLNKHKAYLEDFLRTSSDSMKAIHSMLIGGIPWRGLLSTCNKYTQTHTESTI